MRLSVCAVAFGLVACAEEVPTYTPPASIQAVFDPSTTPPAVPTPTDLAKDPATGLLKVPVADAATAQAQAYFDTFLNTLNGFPQSATAEVKFTAELDPASVTKDTVVVFDLSDAAKPARMDGLTLQADLLYDTSGGTKASLVRIWNYAGWKRGTSYAFFVRGGASGVKAKDGKTVTRSALFELAAASEPLCAWDESKSFDASTKTCSAPAEGKPAIGCCTYNYSALIESSVKKTIREKMKDSPIEEQDKAIHAETLAKATDFERMRRGYSKLLPLAEAAGWSKGDVAVLWSFTTVSMNEAVFDPSAAVPQLPTPTDLAKDPTTGLLNIPTAPTASAAEKAFNAYLSSLDGYPTSTSGAVLAFTGELDAASVGASTFKVFEAGTTGVTATADVGATWDATRQRVVVVPKGGFSKRGTTYLVAALGGETGLKNKDTALAKAPKRSALMHLVLSPYPLCSFDATAKKCTNVGVSSFIDDPKEKQGGRTALEKATLFELMRQGMDPVLKAMEAAGVKRDDVIALWSFTIVSMSEVLFDPTSGRIPFPNNLLLDPSGLGKNPPEYKVAIPATPGESAVEKALREGLNTLDGFTTQGKYLAEVAGDVDPASIVPLKTAFVFNLDQQIPTLDAKVAYDAKAGAITVTPTKPFDEKTMYGIILTSNLKAGDAKPDTTGLKDSKGRRLVPAPFMVLLRSKDPLVDASGKSTVSTLDDATAKQAEQARSALKPFFDALEANTLLPIKREDIVSAWTFRTMSITGTAPKLRALPWQALASDGNMPKWQGALDPTLSIWPTAPAGKSYPKDNLAAIAKGVFITVNALDEQGTGAFQPCLGTNTCTPAELKGAPVHFYLTLPKGTMPAAGWPLIVLQHGVYQAKTDIFQIADSFGKAGYATLAFDLIYHGERSWCTKDAECETGTCTLTTGQCGSGVKLKDTDGDGKPDASGQRFVNLLNPFAVRDNMRQYIIDGASLMRSLALPPVPMTSCAPTPTDPKCALASGPTGLTNWGTNNLDRTKIYFVGNSLGSMISTPFLTVDSLPKAAALSVPGAPTAHVFLGSPTYGPLVDTVLPSLKITKGSFAYVRTFETIFQWVLDPADPGNFAKHLKLVPLPDLVAKTDGSVLVPKKEVIVTLATNDEVIPIDFGKYLAAAAGIDVTKTTYTAQKHGMLLVASPDQKATDALRAQIVKFFSAGTVCTPNLTDGSCN
jgi:hypothetical protein